MNFARPQNTTSLHAQTNGQKQKKLTLAMASEVRWRYVRISIKADDMIATYWAALKKPNTNGTYNVNGKVKSMLDIKRRIRNLLNQHLV